MNRSPMSRSIASLLRQQYDKQEIARSVGRVHEAATSAELPEIVAVFLDAARTSTYPDAMSAIHSRLAEVPVELRGFAYEGAAMSAHILDRLCPGRAWRVPLLVGGVGCKFRYLVHVGVGWGMARLGQRKPRTAWGLDPLLRWLALDGRGFHDLFFADRHQQTAMLAAELVTDADHIVMQGRGRALWFVKGADLSAVCSAVESASEQGKDALWRGVGLASAYAGSDRPTILDLLQAAPMVHHGAIRQGLRFAGAALFEGGRADPPGLVEAVGSGSDCERLASSLAIDLTTRTADAPTFRDWQTTLERPGNSAATAEVAV